MISYVFHYTTEFEYILVFEYIIVFQCMRWIILENVRRVYIWFRMDVLGVNMTTLHYVK